MTKKSRLEGARAVTAYTVLGSKDDCALVELSPTTGEELFASGKKFKKISIFFYLLGLQE